MKRQLLYLIFFVIVLMGCNMTANIAPSTTPEPVITATAQATATQTVTASPSPSPTNTATLVPTAQLPPVCNPRTDWLLYSVIAGDTLGSIANRIDSTANELAVANCIANPNTIQIGQQIRVPRLPQTIPTPFDRTPRILSFILTSSYPSMLEWRTENAGKVKIYVSDSTGEGRLIGTYDPNASIQTPATSGVATFRLTLQDVNGNDVIGANGLPVYAIAQSSGGGNGGAELDCPSATSFGSGIVDVAPIDSSWSRCVFVQTNQTLTLTWGDMPSSIQSIEYYFIPQSGNCSGAAIGNPDVVTSDLDTTDGSAAFWYVGYDACAGVLYAFGYPSSGIMFETQQRPIVIR